MLSALCASVPVLSLGHLRGIPPLTTPGNWYAPDAPTYFHCDDFHLSHRRAISKSDPGPPRQPNQSGNCPPQGD